MTAAMLRRPSSIASPDDSRMRVALVIMWSVTAAAATGSLAAHGAPRHVLLLPVAVAACIALGVLALRRFELFVLAVLVSRASLDAGKFIPSASAPSRAGAQVRVGPHVAQAAQSTRELDPSVLIAVLFVVAGAIWLVGRHRESTIRHLPMTLPAIAFTAAAALSLIDSKYRANGLQELARLASVAGMLLVLEALLTSGSRVRRLLIAIYASALVPLLVAAQQVVFHHGWAVHGETSRVRGTFLHPNPFAIYLSLLLVMGIALMPALDRRWRLIAWPMLTALAAAEVLTYTRAAWAGLVVGIVIVGMLQSRRLIAGLAIAVILIGLAAPAVANRVANSFEGRRASGAAGNSLSWRFDYWQESVSLARRNPVTGIGLGATSEATDTGKEPHNDVVRAFAETGVIGLFAYLAMLIGFVVTAVRSVRRAPPGIPHRIAVGYAGCVAVFIVASMASNVVSQVVLLWYFAAFAAAAGAAARLTDMTKRNTATAAPIGASRAI